MSIATEITALHTNLRAAKSAVTAKGGTVGDTGLAGLASEIATIPSGGGDSYVPPIPSEFGVIHYWSSFSTEWRLNSSYGCTVNSVDQTKLVAYMNSVAPTETNINFEYADWMGGWYFYGDEEEVPVDLTQAGINVSLDDPYEASMYFIKTEIADVTSPVLTSYLASLAETVFSVWAQNHSTSVATIKRFDCGWSTGAYPNGAIGATIGNVSYLRSDGSRHIDVDLSYFSGTSVGNNFLTGTLSFLTPCNFDSIQSAGNYFAYGIRASSQTIPHFASGWSLRGLTNIPDDLLSGGTGSFQSLRNGAPLLLPDTVTTIGANFLRGQGWRGVIKLPQGVTSIGREFISRYNQPLEGQMILDVGSVGPSVISGSGVVDYDILAAYELNTTKTIIIKGSARNAWLTRFPNGNTSSGYSRNLVDGGE